MTNEKDFLEELNTEDKSKSTIHIAMAQTEVPRIVEKPMKEWVDFGTDNLYPQLLIDLMNSSAIHGAILESKAKMVAGKGLTYIKEGLIVEDQAAIERFIKNPNEDETLEEIVKKISVDFEVFGAFCLEIIYAKTGKKIAQINHVDPSLIRSGKFNKERKIEEYYYSEDWSQWRKPEYEPIPITAFDPNNKDKRQLLYVKGYRPGQKYYGVPGWIAAKKWIEIDGELGVYHHASILNGMTPSLWVNFKNGQPPPEEQRQIFKDIKTNYVGSKNSGKFLLTFSDGKDTSPDITKLEFDTARDAMFILLNTQSVQNILAGHRVTSPMLFGIKEAGQLGGNKELETSFKIFDRTVITPSQVLIEKTLNKLMRLNGIKGGMKIDKADIVEFSFDDKTLTTIMTVNEMRRKISLPDLTDEQIAQIRTTLPVQSTPENQLIK